MKADALWFSFISYHCLSESMWLSLLLAFGCSPLSVSNISARFLQGTSLHLLSEIQNQSYSHMVKDWLYGLFCLYKQFSDPLQKSEFTIIEEGKLQRDIKRGRSVWGCERRKGCCGLRGILFHIYSNSDKHIPQSELKKTLLLYTLQAVTDVIIITCDNHFWLVTILEPGHVHTKLTWSSSTGAFDHITCSSSAEWIFSQVHGVVEGQI